MRDLNHYRRLRYNRRAEPVVEEDGTRYWVALVDELPGCKTDGATQVEALLNLDAAFDEYVLACLDGNLDIPEPAKPHNDGMYVIEIVAVRPTKQAAVAAETIVSETPAAELPAEQPKWLTDEEATASGSLLETTA